MDFDFTFPIVQFDFYRIFIIFRDIVFGWINTATNFVEKLSYPITQLIPDALDFLGLEFLSDAIENLINTIFINDFSLLSMLSGGYFLILITLVIITIVARWVLDIGPL